MAEPPVEGEPKAPVLFRRGKKKKAYRQRGENEADDTTNTAESGSQPPVATAPAAAADADGSATVDEVRIKQEDGRGEEAAAVVAGVREDDDDDDEEDAGISVAEALRLRNARKHKMRAVDLRADGGVKPDEPPSMELVVKEEPPAPTAEVVPGMGKRFAPQTGLVGELVNRHMEEYIESELARRQHAADEATPASRRHFLEQPAAAATTTTTATGGLRGEAPAQPAVRGKLQEVDLGQEMRNNNIVATALAARRMHGGIVDEDPEDDRDDAKAGAKRKRRPSEDAIRDKMVEEFLRESQAETYNMLDSKDQEDNRDENRVAEDFRREFMEAIHQRNRRRRPAINHHKRPPKRSESEILKGPKLGGSRNSRAAVREILLKEANEKRAAARR